MKKSLPELAELVIAEYVALRDNPKRVKTKRDWDLACAAVYQKYDAQTEYFNELAFRTAIGKHRSALRKKLRTVADEMKATAGKVIEVLVPKPQVEQLDLFQQDARRGGFSTM